MTKQLKFQQVATIAIAFAIQVVCSLMTAAQTTLSHALRFTQQKNLQQPLLLLHVQSLQLRPLPLQRLPRLQLPQRRLLQPNGSMAV